MMDATFRYVNSSDIPHKIQIKIGTLEGEIKTHSYETLLRNPLLKFSGINLEKYPPLKICVEIYSDGKRIGLPVISSYRSFSSRWSWNEWLTLPILFSDLTRYSILAITVYDCSGNQNDETVVGGTSISLFGKTGVLRQGLYDLKMWPEVRADGNYPPRTPGKCSLFSNNQMQRLSKLAKKHRNGQIEKVDWLDRLTFREVELINEKEKRNSNFSYLMVEFPELYVGDKNCTVVYREPDSDTKYLFASKPKLVTILDTETLQENLVERKHHRLSRSARSGISDRDAKPTASVRDLLHSIVYRYSSTSLLGSEEQDLIWKYRFYLSTQKKALTKFLKCINWETGAEVRQALTLLAKWAPMDVEDALELLNSSFNHPTVRRYAISRLDQAPDEDLLLYLLQLVQALKYEHSEETFKSYHNFASDKDFLQIMEDNATENSFESRLATVDDSLLRSEIRQDVTTNMTTKNEEAAISNESSTVFNDNADVPHNLVTFLIERACKNSTLANYLYWYLSIECEEETVRKQDERVREMYVAVLNLFLRQLSTGSSELKMIYHNLKEQQKFIDNLVRLVKMVTKEPGNRKKKMEKFQQLLTDGDMLKMHFTKFDPLPFPLDPNICIRGIVPEKVTLFKSALMPSKLTFLTTDGSEYVAIFKHGDDLRQDQLILQMITLMDKLLQKENLDLKLTPYRVLATSSKHGFMQYIDSITVAEVLTMEGSIINFFRKHHPCETGPYGIHAEVMDTYIKSCAGYCVITYLLGVGDRHLDNLLLTHTGKLFHIDFGYILGRDPKPMPPPMKLSKEMVEAMGGLNSDHYQEFRKLCYTAFLHLRRHANVMLNLFGLMVDASIPDIALEPDKAVKKVEDNLHLHLTDEEAVQHLQNLLDISITAVMPALVEQIHKLAQYWRK
ncbi:phosphatidylinositol 3-kinase catalytic subunit type 3 [Toxorhynchites rutilus septentrionalis]|uniref:phosphatidylinositol 3-kinase catalytic subunit type 3 n=1 Tax=Toxorhynchites rutilus septentrionalis TaxID=329112 RepID=UPI00247ABF1E|nr:phosphatidylinositol 3-kinase catalytic subunit type 3 [Toxorhynchites rutilus septentrionalis]